MNKRENIANSHPTPIWLPCYCWPCDHIALISSQQTRCFRPRMAGLSQGPQGHPLQVSSEMLKLSEIDPTIAPLGRIRGCKFFSLCFSKNSYYFILDLTTSSPHMQKSRRMFVFLVPLKMSSRFGFISSHQF